MNLGTKAIGSIAGLFALVWSSPALAACSAHSGQRTAALVELYTSEGCSSCPPADQELSRLPASLGPDAEGFALALHVDYWDSLGWRDPYAQRVFSERQRWLVQANHHGVVYTPHFFVSGTEQPPGGGTLSEQVRRVNARPAQAQIELVANQGAQGGLTLDVVARAPQSLDPLALYLAIAENRLVSRVLRGENGGSTLTHDHVARTWFGPIALSGGEARLHRETALPGEAKFGQLEVTAFVEDERTGSVLQAVSLQPCTTSETPLSRAGQTLPSEPDPRLSILAMPAPGHK